MIYLSVAVLIAFAVLWVNVRGTSYLNGDRDD
jgi:hypothetical protein